MSGHVQDLLSAYLDGELSPPERAMVEAHLAACDACAERLEDFTTLDTTLRALPVEPPPGYFDAFPGRVRERVRGQAAPAPRWRVPVWGWAAAAALLLAVVTPLTLDRARQSPAVPAAAPGGESAPARQAQAATDEAPAPPANAALRSAPYAGGHGGLGQSAGPPRAVPEPPARVAAEAVPAATPDGRRENQLGKTAAGAGTTFAAPPAETRDQSQAPHAVELPRQAEERRAESAAPSQAELGALASAAPPRPRAPAAPLPAAPTALREDALAEAAAAPVAKPEAALVGAVPAPPSGRLVDAERDAAQSERKEKAATESEGATVPRAAAAGARGRAPGSARASDDAAGDEYAALRARGTPGSAGLEQARTLRDDWRSFAARNPSGARGDEARFQVIEAGYRAWRLGRDAADRAVLARDARTYLERAAGLHTERVRAILAELERE